MYFYAKMWREREKRKGRSLQCQEEAPSVEELVSTVSVAHLMTWDYVTREAPSDEQVEHMYSAIQERAKRLGVVAERLSRHLTRGAHLYRTLNGKQNIRKQL